MPERRKPPYADIYDPGGKKRRPECSQCRRSVDLVVVVGAVPNYDEEWAQLCPVCLLSALRTLRTVGTKTHYLKDRMTYGTGYLFCTACGFKRQYKKQPRWFTSDKSKVTCKSCRNTKVFKI